MELHELKNVTGARKRRKLLGRGPGSGRGKTSGRGEKGQLSRSGGGKKPGFEGGQMPLYRRLPKRGFTNIFQKNFSIVNVDQLNIFEDNTKIDSALLKEAGLTKARLPVKILGRGELKRKLKVKAKKFSKTAEEKIKAKGGTCEKI